METTVDKKPDGTKVETVTETDGTKIVRETKTKPNGTKVKKETTTKPDGSKVESETTTNADGSKVESETVTNADGSKVANETVTNADGTVKSETTTTTKADGSATEVVKETEKNSAGKDVTITTTTKTNAGGDITSKIEKSVIAADKGVTVTVKTHNGYATASAAVSKPGTTTKRGVEGIISTALVDQITEAAGTRNVIISQKVTAAAGKAAFTVKINANDLAAGNTLSIVRLDKNGNPVLVNAKAYKVSAAGDVGVTMNKSGTYQLLSASAAKKVSDTILKTVKVKDANKTVKEGQTVKVAMNSRLNMSNVSKITYSVSNKSVAKVSSSGKITAKNAGTVTVKAKVTLKNGKTKTVSMKVKVK